MPTRFTRLNRETLLFLPHALRVGSRFLHSREAQKPLLPLGMLPPWFLSSWFQPAVDHLVATDKETRAEAFPTGEEASGDRKSTRLNSSHVRISYAVFCLKK